MSSRPASTPVVVEDARATTRDGAILAADVAYVDDSTRRPILLIRTPYSRAAAHAAYDLVTLARDGWAVVLQDVRGRGDSAGMFTAFDQEVGDGAEAVSWCASQPWSDGRVVMTGVSYLGAAQWAAAAGKPSQLRAINPSLAPSTPAADWLWHGDAFQIGLAASWTAGVLASSPDDTARARAAELAGSLNEVLTTSIEDDPLCAMSASYRAWRRRDAEVTQWLPTDTPAFNVVGWYDAFAESGIAAHRNQHAAGAPILTVVGPWAHNERLTSLYPEIDFGALGNGELTDIRGQALGWLRQQLDVVAQVTETPTAEIRYFVMGLGEWRTAATWPPPTDELRLFLTGDGRLDIRPDAHTSTRTWRHRAADPAPSWGGRTLGPFLPLPGPADQRPLAQRDDVIEFTGDVLEQPVVVTGDVDADVSVSSTAGSFDVAVRLSDVHPDGRILLVVDDVQRVDAITGVPGDVRVRLGATAHAFLPGHRIHVTVAGAHFPRYDVNPRVDADHSVHLGGSAVTSLRLPVSR